MRLRFALVPLLLLEGCVGPGMLTDGTSVSVGTHSWGALRHGSTLPFSGDGYLMPRRWRERGRNYGTEELVQLLVRTARKVRQRCPGGTLGIADLSPRGGGQTPEHRSHHSGRDVDLLYYSTDLQGKPLLPVEMDSYGPDGLTPLPEDQEGKAKGRKTPGAPAAKPVTVAADAPGEASQPPRRKLDLQRNWHLIRSLVSDEEVPVQWIFIGRSISEMLIAYAVRAKEPEHLIERARILMRQPADAQSHNDHMHIRTFCSLSDRRLGCIDKGPPRWFKKDIKYVDVPPWSRPLPPVVQGLPVGVVRVMGF